MNFYEVIARCLIDSQVNEAYVLVGQQISGLGPSEINQAILSLSTEVMPSVSKLARDYQMLSEGSSCIFADGVSSFLDVQGVIIEFSISKIGTNDWRVFFHRVDAGKLLATTQSRLDAVERQLHDLEVAIKTK
jgi:hypothetical protein